MATNYLYPGEVITITLGADAASGSVVREGNIVGFATSAGLSGANIGVQICGVWNATNKVTGVAWSKGDFLYYDSAADKVTSVANANTYLGEAHADAASGATECEILLGRATPAAGFASGTATLVSGTVTVALVGMAATSKVVVSLKDVNSSTALGTLVAAPGTDQFVITSVDPGTPANTQTNDVSIVDWIAFT